MFVFLQSGGGRDCEGPCLRGKGLGRRERGREREGVGMFFVKECLMTKGTRCNFLCWLGSLGENVVMSVKKKRLYDMYGYERVFLICWRKKGKGKP